MSVLLEVNKVDKFYGKHQALNQVSLQVEKGSIFGLLGPNGAGKTSLLRLINQITFPDNGHIFFDGQPLKPHHISQIGYLPEERGLYKSMKVGEQALYLAQLKGMSKSEAQSRLQFWFKRLDIEAWWDKKIQELSKGMAQKVQFVVTVLHQPKLLIFDEPFSGFDPVNAQLIKEEIMYLKEQGSTIIFSTHRMESVEELCDHIALIHQSHKILDGSLSDIKKQFRTHEFTLGVCTDFPEKVNELIRSKYEGKPTQFKSLDEMLKFTVRIPETQMNVFLNEINTVGTLLHLTEKIPSMEEIFIQKVTRDQLI